MQTQVKAPANTSFTPTYGGLLQRKCACGGTPGLDGECAGCRRRQLSGQTSPLIQPKLRISQPGDKYEQEADRVAEQVMRMSDKEVSGPPKSATTIQRKCSSCTSSQGHCPKCAEVEGAIQRKLPTSNITPLIQRQFEEPEEDEELLQAKAESGQTTDVTTELAGYVNSMRGGGQPLPESVRAFFEPRFARDFSQVRVHTDAKAAKSVHSVNALAYTVGRDVIFGAGQYAPQTKEGRRLLAHELTHVVRPAGRRRERDAQAAMALQTQPVIVQRQRERPLVKEYRAELPTDEQLAKADEETLQKSLARTQQRIDELSLTDPGSPEYERLIIFQSKLLDALYPVLEGTRATVLFDESTRADIVVDTKFRIGLAYTAYVSACNAEKQRLRDAVAAEIGVLDLLFGIALGPIAVAVSRKIAKLMGKLASEARNIKYVYSEARKVMLPVKTPLAKVLELSQDETMVRELFKSGTTAAYALAKKGAEAVYAKTETGQFINQLETTAQLAFQEVGTRLPARDDNTQDLMLLVIWVAFHADVSNKVTYSIEVLDLVTKFQKYVLAIDPVKPRPRGYVRDSGDEPVWVIFEGGLRALALVRIRRRLSSTWMSRDYNTYEFLRWISKRFHKAAIARLEEEQNKPKLGGPWSILAKSLYRLGGRRVPTKGLSEAMSD